jgi:hypothetical protein
VSIKRSAVPYIITCTYFINIILYVMCRFVYNLVPYEISYAYVLWSFFHQKRNPKNVFLLSPSWYFIIHNYVYEINFYILYDLVEHSTYSKRRIANTSKVRVSSAVLLPSVCNYSPRRLGDLQGHHNFYTRF